MFKGQKRTAINRLCSILIAIQLLGAWAALAQEETASQEKQNPQPSSLTFNTVGDTALSDFNEPAIAVSPRLLDFGPVPVGSARELSFMVRNVNCGILAGAASVTAPFHVVEGSPYNLSNGQTRVIRVQFAPKSRGIHMTSVRFTEGGDSITVTGFAISRLRKSPTRPDSPPHTSPAPPTTPAPPRKLRLLAAAAEQSHPIKPPR